MTFTYDYKDALLQCKTLLTKSFAKLLDYSKREKSSPANPSEKDDDVNVSTMKQKLDTILENVAMLKSEFDDLTRYNQSSSSFADEFPDPEESSKYLVQRHEALRLKFIQVIDECQKMNTCLDNLENYSVGALAENGIQNPSECLENGTNIDPNTVAEERLSSVPQICAVNSDYTVEESVSLNVSKSKEMNVSVLYELSKSSSSNGDVSVAESSSTTISRSKRRKVLASSKKPNGTFDTEQLFVCQICEKKFHNRNNLERHVASIHERLRPYKCPVCDKSCSRKYELKSHILSTHVPHHSKQCKCDICDKYVDSNVRVKKSSSATSLRTNKEKYLNKSKQNKPSNFGPQPLEFQSLIPNADLTVKKFDSTTALGTQEMKGLTTLKRNEASFVCKICDRTFSQRNNLYRHMISHENWKRFKCTDCCKSFTRNTNLKKHALSKHTSCQPNECDIYVRDATAAISSKGLNRDSSVKKRDPANLPKTKKINVFSIKERNEASYIKQSRPICNICEKTFVSKTGLKRHAFLHQGLKPHKCTECSFACALKANLKRHMLFKHVPYHSKQCECDLCGTLGNVTEKELNSTKPLKTNKEEYLRLPEQNNALSLGNGNGERHKQTIHVETNEKLYGCMNCGKRYKRCISLEKHLRSQECVPTSPNQAT